MTVGTTPTGRLVWGHPMERQPVMNDSVKPPVQKTNADGSLAWEYPIGVAFAKTDPAWPAFRAALKAADAAAWPQFHENGEIRPGVVFADKITDGDSYNSKGEPRAKEGNGYAGHWIVKFATRFPPTVFGVAPGGQSWLQLTDAAEIKAGDYIQVSYSTASNGSQQSPGMYRNFDKVALIQQGPVIIKGVSPDKAFGAPPPGAHVVAGGLTPPQAGVPVTPPVVAASVTPPVAPPAPVGSYTAHMAVPPAAPAVPVAPPVPVAPVRQMLPAANGASYESMLAAGWTDALLVQHGMMAG